MKRFSGKEALLLTAPIAVVGLVIWGVPLRERYWPKRAPFTCEVRQPTPLEISQGAQVGVTIRTSVPKSQLPNWTFDYRLVDPSRKIDDFQQKVTKATVWEQGHVMDKGRYTEVEANRAYNWTALAPWNQSLTASIGVNTRSRTVPTFQQQVELTTNGISLPDRRAARKTNFRINQVVLNYGRIGAVGKLIGTPIKQRFITIYLSDLSDERRGLTIDPTLVGSHIEQGSTRLSLAKMNGQVFSHADDFSEVILTSSDLRVPPPRGSKIHFSLSVNAGWPQEITLEAPEKLPKFGGAMKFTAKLAPLPRK